MPTWHQNRRPVKWYHETLWTVACGTGPGEFLTLTTAPTEARAREYETQLRANGYQHGIMVIPPAGMYRREP